MKKWISFVLSVALLLGLGLVACGDQFSGSGGTGQPDNGGEQQSMEPAGVSGSNTQNPTGSDNPVVYMTTDISPEGLMAVYKALGWTPEGKVAVKLSTGEPPASNYLRPELIAGLVQYVDGTIVECNTAYGGSRPRPPCTTKWQRTMALLPLRLSRSSTKTAPCLCRSQVEHA